MRLTSIGSGTQHPEGGRGHRREGLADSSERGSGPRGDWDVVEADHTEIARGRDDWETIPAGGATASRGLGVLDMARSLRAGTAHRASGELALHVLDTMEAVARSIDAGTSEHVPTTFETPGRATGRLGSAGRDHRLSRQGIL